MEWFFAITVAVGLIWAAVLLFRGSLMAVCLAFLFANACFGFFFFQTRVGPIEFTLDRILLILVACSYVLHRRLRQTEPKPLGKSDWIVLAFLGWLTLRTFTDRWWQADLDFPKPVWHLIVGYLSPLFIYWVVRNSPLTQRNIRLMNHFFIGLGIYLGFTAIAEVTGQWWAVFPWHIADPEVGLHFGRARGPMVHSIVLGFVLSICLCAAWIHRRRLGFYGQLALVACLPLLLAGIYFSYTRCVWMGGVLGLLIVAGLTATRRTRILIVAGVLSMGLLVTVAKWDSILNFQGGRSAADTRNSAYMRTSFAYVSWQMFKDAPFLGHGFGQYVNKSNLYVTDRSTSLTLESIRDQLHH
ncbi:MAG: O-antigen ligase family protein, partial [Pirellulales bacterium]